MNAEEKRKYNRNYYLANKATWATAYLRNRRRVLAGKTQRSKRTRRFWNAEDLKVLKRLYPHHSTAWVAGQLDRSESSLNGRATELNLKKDPTYKAQAWRQCGIQLQEAGRSHRFQKGHVSANKGMRRPGWSAGRMKETQFRKGQRSGAAAAHYKPLGAERLIHGYRYVKVAEVPNVPYTVNWKLVHVLNWERANGRPLPAGHILRFRDRNKLNVAVGNLELLTRRENILRNSLHNLPKELAEVMQLRGALVRQINKRIRNEKQD